MSKHLFSLSGKRPASIVLVLHVVMLAAIVIGLEFVLGDSQERKFVASLENNPGLSWADRHFASWKSNLPIPEKRGRIRILYLSNSHALTGGRVSNHLQLLIDRLCPGKAETIDLSSPGMFAPEYLQRLAASLEYDIDAVVLPVSYISFSDRMPLRRQALSARSMFKPAVFSHLPLGFWLRNWDVGVYSDALIARFLRLYRYRNDIRDLWETPLANQLKLIYRVPKLRFLEFDEQQAWRFPDGFDQNLFDWRLYRDDRDQHLADMSSAVDLAAEKGVKVIASNLPIDWQKEPRPFDGKDVSEYRAQVATVFENVLDFVDYEGDFPKAFSTYDALHPTWHGARLHAFDLALRLKKRRILPCESTEDEILNAFLDSDQALSAAYRENLRKAGAIAPSAGFRRFDVTEPANAGNLLSRFQGKPIYSPDTHRLLVQLALRVRFWTETDFQASASSAWSSGVRKVALTAEIERAVVRTQHFVKALKRVLSAELDRYPLPSTAGTAFRGETRIAIPEEKTLVTRRFLAGGGMEIFVSRDLESGRKVSVIVLDHVNGSFYERVDVMGDGTFLQVYKNPTSPHVPSWVFHERPQMNFGI